MPAATANKLAADVSLLTKLRIWYYFSVPRTWLYAVLGYHFGYYLGSGGDLGWKLWVGDIIYGPLGTGATNFINMVWDQKEDSVNKPVRSTYIRYVTGKQLTAATYICFVLSLLLAALYRDANFMAWTFVDIFHSHQYSAPPLRLKGHWLTNNTFLSLGSNTVPFIAGWMVSRPASEMPMAALFLQFIFIMFTLISKDVPDIEGDIFAGLATIPKDFGIKYYRILAFVPHVLCLGLILSGYLEQRYLIFLAASFLTISYILGSDAGNKLVPHDNRITHFVKVFTYSQMGDCLLFTLMFPQFWVFGLVTAVVSFVFIFTSGYLYPDASCGVEAANPQHGG